METSMELQVPTAKNDPCSEDGAPSLGNVLLNVPLSESIHANVQQPIKKIVIPLVKILCD